MECPRCRFVSQDASPTFCSNCGHPLAPSLRTGPPPTEKGGGEAKEMEVEMEPGRSLRVEGAPSSGPGAETKDMKGKPEEMLMQGSRAQTSGSKKKAVQSVSEVEAAIPPARKRRKENPGLPEGSSPSLASPRQVVLLVLLVSRGVDTSAFPRSPVYQHEGFFWVDLEKKKKKKKKKKDAPDTEQPDSLKSDTPSTDCSLVSEKSCDPFPALEGATQEDKVAKPGTALPAGRTAGETKSSGSLGPLGEENKNTEMAVGDHCSSTSARLQDDACGKTAQPTGSTAPQEKMEDGNPKGDGEEGREERGSEKQEDARSPAETEQALGKASDAQTSGADGGALGSKGAGEEDSPGLSTSTETPENEEASPSAEAVNQKSKVSPTEPRDTQSREGKVERESKQQAHAPVSEATSQVVVGGQQKAAGGS
ncbi:PREDICTED: E3 ubiquitin-protein ligase RNF213-like, partial [Gavialis gangeticus]|uniref:E3 ubiquitin-protein ligase RNF213-like n=1 Tax=Gavialis gangeticus TaxID=94835 RepID=UPI00092E563D